jgi:hypothetical protein
VCYPGDKTAESRTEWTGEGERKTCGRSWLSFCFGCWYSRTSWKRRASGGFRVQILRGWVWGASGCPQGGGMWVRLRGQVWVLLPSHLPAGDNWSQRHW